MIKDLKFASHVWDIMSRSINTLARVVGKTMGPSGKQVLISEEGGRLTSTRDGVTVARAYTPINHVEKMAVDLAKEAAIKTVEVAGDGTSTAIVLVNELMWNARRLIMTTEISIPEFVKGMEAALTDVLNALNMEAEPCKDKDLVRKICMVASNHDPAIADMVSETMDLVGRQGLIVLEDSVTDKSYSEWHEGMEIEAGYSHEAWRSPNSDHFYAPNCLVFVYMGDLTDGGEGSPFLPIFEHCSTYVVPLLIICHSAAGKFLELVGKNNNKAFKCCIVHHPGFGPMRDDMMIDVATLTGATAIEESGFGLQQLKEMGMSALGKVSEAIVTYKNCGLVVEGDPEKIQARVDVIEAQIGSLRDEYEREQFRERCAKLISGTAKIHVGAATDIERAEKKMRVEDAIHAARSAVEEGIIPGGGWGLERIAKALAVPGDSLRPIDFDLGYTTVIESCSGPKRTIYDNAGLKNDWTSQFKWTGVDAMTGERVNFLHKGIVDGVKCMRAALENAVSVAKTIIQSDVMISINRKEPPREDVALSRKREAAGVHVR